MKLRNKVISIQILMLIMFLLPNGNGLTSWNPEITPKNYDWVVSVSRSQNFSSYERPFSVGSTNLLGGGIRLELKSQPDENFLFLENDRLNYIASSEGVVVNLPAVNGSDYHLMILPIAENGTSFFELLFNEIILLENLTNSGYVNSALNASVAILNTVYQENYTISYEWDVLSGLLVKKTVKYQENIEFEVIQGIGYGYRPFRDFFIKNIFAILPVSALIILTLVGIFSGKKKKS